MCILSIVRSADKTILSFNRDEDAGRPFASPETDTALGLFCPLDLKNGGTWIGLNRESIMCIQNGAKIKHQRKPFYGKSRGLILKSMLVSGVQVLENELLNADVEPFTITILDRQTKGILLFYYDGSTLEKEKIKDINGFIRFSSTLYSPDFAFDIEQTFAGLINPDEDALLEFHRQHRIGGPGNTHLSRPSTSSITQFVLHEGRADCRFYNLLDHTYSEYHNVLP